MSYTKSIIVTGGAGFIGGTFIDLLLDLDMFDTVVCFDKLTYAAQPERVQIHSQNKKYSFVLGDICDRYALKSLMEGFKPNIVVNFAAESHVDNSLKDESLFYKTNVEGVKNLLDTCIECNVQKFVQISTDEVYGQRLNEERFLEQDPMNPRNPYAKTKMLAEEIVKMYHANHKIQTLITRGCNTLGPWQNKEKLIPKVVHNAFNGLEIPVYGSGLQKREWIAVTEHARAILHLIQNGTFGEIYNIGSGIECTNIDLVNDILKLMDNSSLLIKHVEDRAKHDFQYGVNTEKLISTGWSLDQNFEQFLKTTVEFELARLKLSKEKKDVSVV